MKIIVRNRKIRPSTHNGNGPYRINCRKVGAGDLLRINITHESNPAFMLTYEITRNILGDKNNIHFNAKSAGDQIIINWLDNLKPTLISL